MSRTYTLKEKEFTQVHELFSSSLLKRHKSSSRSFGHSSSHPLYQSVENNLLERLKDIKQSFNHILIMGSASPSFKERLQESFSYPLTLWTADLYSPSVSIKTSYEALPFRPRCFDLIINFFTLHWTNDIPGFLRQTFHLLKPEGLYLGALIGGNSLNELSQALLEAEDLCSGSIALRISPFVKSSQAGALLQRAGFSLPVCDIDSYRLCYETFKDIISDLRRLGDTAAFRESSRPLTKEIYKKAAEIYHRKFVNEQGKLILTTDILYLTGWAPHLTVSKPFFPSADPVSFLQRKPME